MSETLTVPRPTWNDEMVKELSKIVGKQVNEWCDDETPLEDCIETAEEILNRFKRTVLLEIFDKWNETKKCNIDVDSRRFLESTNVKEKMKVEICKDLLVELYEFAYEQAVKTNTVESLHDIDRMINGG